MSTLSPSAPKPSIYGNPPASNKPGTFPREYIAGGESVIFESRPTVLGFITGPIIRLVILSIFFGLYAFAVSSVISAGSPAIYVPLFLFVVLPILGLIVPILSWRNTAYAITDRRTMQSRGIISRNTNDCAHDKIQSVNLHQGIIARIFGYGNIAYLTAGANVNFKKERAVISAGGVYWKGVRDPVSTRRYVEEVVNKAREQMKIKEFQSMAAVLRQQGATIMPGATITPGAAPMQAVVSSATPSGKFCGSCGASVDMNSKFCKSCGAQVLVEA
jgi:membrane protein YdbS with pleckstrin-like domain